MSLSNALEAVSNPDLLKLTSVFKSISQALKASFSVDETALENQFNAHVHGILEKLENRLPSMNEDSSRQIEVLMAKYGLYDYIFQQVHSICCTGMFLS
jgi:hypothetical protein